MAKSKTCGQPLTQVPPSDLEKFLPNPHASMVENHAARNAIIAELNRLDDERRELEERMKEISTLAALLKEMRRMHDALQANGIGKFLVPKDDRDDLIQLLIDNGLCAEKVDNHNHVDHNLIVWIRKGS